MKSVPKQSTNHGHGHDETDSGQSDQSKLVLQSMVLFCIYVYMYVCIHNIVYNNIVSIAMELNGCTLYVLRTYISKHVRVLMVKYYVK